MLSEFCPVSRVEVVFVEYLLLFKCLFFFCLCIVTLFVCIYRRQTETYLAVLKQCWLSPRSVWFS